MTSLYVHVPFCLKKCSYCTFYSLPLSAVQVRNKQFYGDSDLISSYLSGVKREIALRNMEAPHGVSSLFLGGGTPTVLSPNQLDRLLGEIHQHFVIQDKPNIEKTVEANPGTLDAEKLDVLKNYGINRISLGVQSYNDILLKKIGRIHTSKDIDQAVSLVRRAGFSNLNLDLIFGLPGQIMEDWQDSLNRAVELSPQHLSIYALTLEEDTPLGRRYLSEQTAQKTWNSTCSSNHLTQSTFELSIEHPFEIQSDLESPVKREDFLPDDDLQADMYEWAVGFLQEKGYDHYEISNFARQGYECRHNLSYWRSEDYIGLGPGAVSCIQAIRTKNIENITAYTRMLKSEKKPFDLEETEVLTPKQLISEYMMLGLRTAKGIDIGEFNNKFMFNIQDIYGQIMANYMDRNVLFLSEERLMINPSYYFIANSIILDFIQ